METDISVLSVTALTIGALHTLAGPDHYLPFVAMAKARSWSTLKTINIVTLCGIGHVFSSIIIGFIGIAAGFALSGVEKVEGIRGSIAAWLLLLFGLGYLAWAFYKLQKKDDHHHRDIQEKRKMTFWILFTIFIFGPCEPLIPILMYPAAEHNYRAVAFISVLFALVTIITMIIVVMLMLKGISFVKFKTLERYQHVIAGATITLCGVAIFFGF